MGTTVDRFTAAADAFDARVHAIKDDQWGDPTPCTEWDVRALVGHLVYEMLWVAPLFEGKTIAEVGDRYEGDNLGDDPVGAWERAVADARAAVTAPSAIDGTVHLSYGEEKAENYAKQLILDLEVHGWDLAKGIKGDAVIEPGAAQAILDELNVEGLAGSGSFASPVGIADDASPGDRLVALTGRSPSWPN